MLMSGYDGPAFKGSDSKRLKKRLDHSFDRNKATQKNKSLKLQRQTQGKTQYTPAFLKHEQTERRYDDSNSSADLPQPNQADRPNYQVPFLKGEAQAEMQAKLDQVNQKQQDSNMDGDFMHKTSRNVYKPSLSDQGPKNLTDNKTDSIQRPADDNMTLPTRSTETEKLPQRQPTNKAPSSYQWQVQVQNKNKQNTVPASSQLRQLAKRMTKTKDTYILFEEME